MLSGLSTYSLSIYSTISGWFAPVRPSVEEILDTLQEDGFVDLHFKDPSWPSGKRIERIFLDKVTTEEIASKGKWVKESAAQMRFYRDLYREVYRDKFSRDIEDTELRQMEWRYVLPTYTKKHHWECSIYSDDGETEKHKLTFKTGPKLSRKAMMGLLAKHIEKKLR